MGENPIPADRAHCAICGCSAPGVIYAGEAKNIGVCECGATTFTDVPEEEAAEAADLQAAKERLMNIALNRPMSALHPRFSVFEEALAELVSAGEISKKEVAYLAFCYAEQLSK